MKTPSMRTDSEERKMKLNARTQHEIVHGKLKQFNVLTTHSRHMKPYDEEVWDVLQCSDCNNTDGIHYYRKIMYLGRWT